MANKPKQSPKKEYVLTDAEKYIIEENARRLEAQKVKSYEDILSAASQNAEDVGFKARGLASAWNASSPYYGNEAQSQLKIAQEYAAQLQNKPSHLVNIDPTYYQDLMKQVPVIVHGAKAPGYNVSEGMVQMPAPKILSDYQLEMVKNQKLFAENNRNPIDYQPDTANANKFNYWKQALEHELNHVPDKNITFAEKPPLTISTHIGSAFDKPTYMAQENHLVTGLGKVQREYYTLTGKRFESPEEFKSFLFGLAQSDNVEEQISSFSEEAKRALRPQIQNAVDVKMFEDSYNEWKNSKSWFKGQAPLIRGNPDLLEKSAQLIPALVSNQDYDNHTS